MGLLWGLPVGSNGIVYDFVSADEDGDATFDGETILPLGVYDTL